MGTKPSEDYELLKVTKMTVFYGNNKIVFIKNTVSDNHGINHLQCHTDTN